MCTELLVKYVFGNILQIFSPVAIPIVCILYQIFYAKFTTNFVVLFYCICYPLVSNQLSDVFLCSRYNTLHGKYRQAYIGFGWKM